MSWDTPATAEQRDWEKAQRAATRRRDYQAAPRPLVCICGKPGGSKWLLLPRGRGYPSYPVPMHPECIPPPDLGKHETAQA